MKLFTIIRNSGFGDYVGVCRVVSAILGPEYKYVVCNQHRYTNYHCKDLDFLHFFYRGEYVDIQPNKILTISFKDFLKNKNSINNFVAITLDNNDFDILSTYGKLDLRPTQNLFLYKPVDNPFKKYTNNIVLHIRVTDLISKNKLIRPIINPKKISYFIENIVKIPANIIICTDSHNYHPISQLIQEINFNHAISIIDRLYGKDIETTIKTMDAIYYADIVISKSSSFVNLFRTKKITVPNEYCVSTLEEINSLINI